MDYCFCFVLSRQLRFAGACHKRRPVLAAFLNVCCALKHLPFSEGKGKSRASEAAAIPISMRGRGVRGAAFQVRESACGSWGTTVTAVTALSLEEETAGQARPGCHRRAECDQTRGLEQRSQRRPQGAARSRSCRERHPAPPRSALRTGPPSSSVQLHPVPLRPAPDRTAIQLRAAPAGIAVPRRRAGILGMRRGHVHCGG